MSSAVVEDTESSSFAAAGSTTAVKIGRASASERTNSEGCSGSANTVAKSSGLIARTSRMAKVSRSTRR
jgi:hypothetical protein